MIGVLVLILVVYITIGYLVNFVHKSTMAHSIKLETGSGPPKVGMRKLFGFMHFCSTTPPSGQNEQFLAFIGRAAPRFAYGECRLQRRQAKRLAALFGLRLCCLAFGCCQLYGTVRVQSYLKYPRQQVSGFVGLALRQRRQARHLQQKINKQPLTTIRFGTNI